MTLCTLTLRPASVVCLQILNISAPLVVLDSTAAAAAGASSSGAPPDLSGIQLCLLDTPGPNEAGEEGLKYQVLSGGGWGGGWVFLIVACFVIGFSVGALWCCFECGVPLLTYQASAVSAGHTRTQWGCQRGCWAVLMSTRPQPQQPPTPLCPDVTYAG